MTTTSNGQTDNRLNRIEAILERMAEHQENTDSNLNDLSNNLNDLSNRVNDFIGTANTVLGRSAVLDDIIVGLDARTTALETVVVMMDGKTTALENIAVRLDRNFEELNRNFGENQRSTNAALERLEAILLKLIDRNGGNSSPSQ